ncbi:Fibronectin type III domain containing protein 1 [Dissostichus eleginoides]|uniref:Fibronectin type III domain containing protein 1 n=1 Tax=Dissostichus eleginoides TaxID=100907 RepID=A0AAD9BSL6_DISEL|nr:Fibronectin type III domain containing protein 1 [Dissostichus eleginoides]
MGVCGRGQLLGVNGKLIGAEKPLRSQNGKQTSVDKSLRERWEPSIHLDGRPVDRFVISSNKTTRSHRFAKMGKDSSPHLMEDVVCHESLATEEHVSVLLFQKFLADRVFFPQQHESSINPEWVNLDGFAVLGVAPVRNSSAGPVRSRQTAARKTSFVQRPTRVNRTAHPSGVSNARTHRRALQSSSGPRQPERALARAHPLERRHQHHTKPQSDQRNRNKAKLTSESVHVVSLQAQKPMGRSAPANRAIATKTTTPEPPEYEARDIGVRVMSPQSVLISWVDPAVEMGKVGPEDIRSYTIKYREKGESARWEYKDSTQRRMLIDTLSADGMYEFSVRISQGDNHGKWSVSVFQRTPESAPSGPPENFEVKPLRGKGTAVIATWDPPEEPNGKIREYIMSYAPAMKPFGMKSVTYLSSASTATVDGLTPGERYIFKIRATNRRGQGPQSKVLSVVMPGSSSGASSSSKTKDSRRTSHTPSKQDTDHEESDLQTTEAPEEPTTTTPQPRPAASVRLKETTTIEVVPETKVPDNDVSPEFEEELVYDEEVLTTETPSLKVSTPSPTKPRPHPQPRRPIKIRVHQKPGSKAASSSSSSSSSPSSSGTSSSSSDSSSSSASSSSASSSPSSTSLSSSSRIQESAASRKDYVASAYPESKDTFDKPILTLTKPSSTVLKETNPQQTGATSVGRGSASAGRPNGSGFGPRYGLDEFTKQDFKHTQFSITVDFTRQDSKPRNNTYFKFSHIQVSLDKEPLPRQVWSRDESFIFQAGGTPLHQDVIFSRGRQTRLEGANRNLEDNESVDTRETSSRTRPSLPSGGASPYRRPGMGGNGRVRSPQLANRPFGGSRLPLRAQPAQNSRLGSSTSDGSSTSSDAASSSNIPQPVLTSDRDVASGNTVTKTGGLIGGNSQSTSSYSASSSSSRESSRNHGGRSRYPIVRGKLPNGGQVNGNGKNGRPNLTATSDKETPTSHGTNKAVGQKFITGPDGSKWVVDLERGVLMNEEGQVLQDSQGKPKRVVLGEDGQTIFDHLGSPLVNQEGMALFGHGRDSQPVVNPKDKILMSTTAPFYPTCPPGTFSKTDEYGYPLLDPEGILDCYPEEESSGMELEHMVTLTMAPDAVALEKDEFLVQTTLPSTTSTTTEIPTPEPDTRPSNHGPSSVFDLSGKKRFTAPYVNYIRKDPSSPCSLTEALEFLQVDVLEGLIQKDRLTDNRKQPPKDKPRNLTVVAMEGCHSFIILDWGRPLKDDMVSGYMVYSASYDDVLNNRWSSNPSSGTHLAVENLKPNSRYYFKVQAKNVFGLGPFSDTLTYVTESDDPLLIERPPGGEPIWIPFSFKFNSAHSSCKGSQYVKRTWYRKFVGVVLCNSLRYKIFMGDGLREPFYSIGDTFGQGEDHCQFVDSYRDGRTGPAYLSNNLPSAQGYYRAYRQQPVSFGVVGRRTAHPFVGWYECGVPIPGKW